MDRATSTLDWKGDILFGVAFLTFGVVTLYADRAAQAAPTWLRPLLRLYSGFRFTKLLFIVVGIASIALGDRESGQRVARRCRYRVVRRLLSKGLPAGD